MKDLDKDGRTILKWVFIRQGGRVKAGFIRSRIWRGDKLISGFRRDVNEICALPGYHEALSGSSVPTFRDNL